MEMDGELRARGFTQTTSDEPQEDYWLLEHGGVRTDYLVEHEGSGWRIHRSPGEDEPQGNWVEVRNGLEDGDLLILLDSLI